MLKTIQKTLLSILSLSLLFSSALLGMDNQSFENLKVIKDIQGKVTGNTLITKNVDIYLVKGKDGSGRPFEIIVDKDGKYLILTSKVINMTTGKPITIPMDITPLKGQEAFTYGTGKNHFYVFTDPECPYCKRFKSTWASIKNDVTFHVYFYNLNSHSNANTMTRWVLDGKTNDEKADRLLKVTNGDQSYKTANFNKTQSQKYNAIINKHRNLGNTLGIQGVPTVISTDGEMVNWAQIKQYLK